MAIPTQGKARGTQHKQQSAEPTKSANPYSSTRRESNPDPDEYDKPKAFSLAGLGDLAIGLVGAIINPNVLVVGCYFLSGTILILNAVPYIDFLYKGLESISSDLPPFLQSLFSVGNVAVASITGVILTLITTMMEIIPILPKIDRDLAKALLHKENKVRAENPYKGENGSTMTRPAFNWVRNSAKVAYKLGVVISIVFFLLDLYICNQKFPMFNQYNEWNIINVFWNCLLVFGVLIFFVLAAMFKQYRLSAKEVARMNQLEAEARKSR